VKEKKGSQIGKEEVISIFRWYDLLLKRS
jgi:hypothetical protein